MNAAVKIPQTGVTSLITPQHVALKTY